MVFFFQAEDGIRDWSVTGVQTCALPISGGSARSDDRARLDGDRERRRAHDGGGRGIDACAEIGRASCRERV